MIQNYFQYAASQTTPYFGYDTHLIPTITRRKLFAPGNFYGLGLSRNSRVQDLAVFSFLFNESIGPHTKKGRGKKKVISSTTNNQFEIPRLQQTYTSLYILLASHVMQAEYVSILDQNSSVLYVLRIMLRILTFYPKFTLCSNYTHLHLFVLYPSCFVDDDCHATKSRTNELQSPQEKKN